MSVTTTTARIAAMGNLISVSWQNSTMLINAFANIPRVIQNAELPCMVILPGEAVYAKDDTGETQFLEERTYQLYVLIQNAAFGTETQGQVAVAPFFDAVRDYFMARPGLELDGATLPQDAVYDAQMTGDHGFEVIPYPGGAAQSSVYLGIVFDLRVREWHGISYQD